MARFRITITVPVALVVLVVMSSARAIGGPATPDSHFRLWGARYDSGGVEFATDVGVTPDAGTVFVTGGDTAGYATVAYDAATGSERWVAHYNSAYGSANALDISPDGAKVFVTGGDDEDFTTIAYDATTGSELWEAHYVHYFGEANEALDLAVSPDGAIVVVTGRTDEFFYSSNYTSTVAYDTATGAQLWSARSGGEYGVGEDVEVSPDGTTAFVTGQGGSDEQGNYYNTDAYDIDTGTRLWESQYNDYFYSAQALRVSPDGTRVFVTGDGYFTLAYDATTGGQLWLATHGYGGSATSLSLSPDANTVYVTGYNWSGTYEYETVAYDATTGTELWASTYDGTGHDDYAYALAVTSDGQRIFVTGQGGGTHDAAAYVTVAYDAAAGTELHVVAVASGTPAALAMSPDGSRVFITGTAGTSPNYDYGTVAYRLTP